MAYGARPDVGHVGRIWGRFQREVRTYQRILRHPRTPTLSKLLLGAALAYALSPIDIIPDWVPVLGYLDDMLIVPGLVGLALGMVPPDVVEECRPKAMGKMPRVE